jgi:hypothetical protein
MIESYIKLEKEFLNTNFVQYEEGFQGQNVFEDGTIIIGNRAGSINWPGSYLISNLVHEMAHLVEIDDARMRCDGWGLKVPEVWVFNRICCEPTTRQITEREIRVTAYQVNVLDYLGEENSVDDIVSSLDYLPDTCYVPLEDGREPYGDNYKVVQAENINIKESQQRWRVNEVNRLRKEYTLERFISEWHRKIKWLNENEYINEFKE